MTSFQDIVDAVKAGHIPLHMAVELSQPGALQQLWNMPSSGWEIVDSTRNHVQKEALIFTRLDVLLDALEALAIDRGILSMSQRQQLAIARQVSLRACREWANDLISSIVADLNGNSRDGRGDMRKFLQRLGPPTLAEILEASNRP